MSPPNTVRNNSGDTLAKIFRYQVEHFQDRVALRFKKHGIWKEVSWKEMMASNQSYAGAVDLSELR